MSDTEVSDDASSFCSSDEFLSALSSDDETFADYAADGAGEGGVVEDRNDGSDGVLAKHAVRAESASPGASPTPSDQDLLLAQHAHASEVAQTPTSGDDVQLDFEGEHPSTQSTVFDDSLAVPSPPAPTTQAGSGDEGTQYDALVPAQPDETSAHAHASHDSQQPQSTLHQHTQGMDQSVAAGASAGETTAPVAPPRRRKKQKQQQQHGEGVVIKTARASATGTRKLPPQPQQAQKPQPQPLQPQQSQALESQDAVKPARMEPGDSITVADVGKPQAPPRRRQLKRVDTQQLQALGSMSQTLTDEEILDMVTLTCLDTGEVMPLSKAESLLPPGLCPLSLQVMRRTNEFSLGGSQTSLNLKASGANGQQASADGAGDGSRLAATRMRVSRFLVRAKEGVGDFAKTVRERAGRVRGDGGSAGSQDEQGDESVGGSSSSSEARHSLLKVKAHMAKDRPRSFKTVSLAQRIAGHHAGPVWVLRLSPSGHLLATAGQDKVVRIWVLVSKFEEVHQHLLKERDDPTFKTRFFETASETDVFHPTPLCEYRGHSSDILDLCWSPSRKNHVVLSSSMDRSVRMWHLLRREALAVFPHDDFVTALMFHPKNELFFLSASLDCKVRLWNIPQRKVVLQNQVTGGECNFITSATFCQDGKFIAAGTYDGRCVIFNAMDKLKYHTTLHISTRGRKGRKISGIQAFENKILVTSNDSRLRVFNLEDHSLVCKYKGLTNTSSQIRAAVTFDSQYIVSASEDRRIFIWDTVRTPPETPSRRWRRDKNEEYYRFNGEKTNSSQKHVCLLFVCTCSKHEPLQSLSFRLFSCSAVLRVHPCLPYQIITELR
eukprot:m.15229 g.15229  ORF g.15229 m.15229 type:complete len:834 (-) comp6537_c0_seq1:750-3251(-)